MTAQNSGRSAARGGGCGPVEVRGGAPVREPGVERRQRAEPCLRRVGPDGDVLTLALLVGLRPPDQQAQPATGDGLDVAQGEGDQLGAAQRGAEAHQQHGALAGAERRVGGGAASNHQAQHAGHRGGGLAARPHAFRPGDAFHHHGEARVAQVERQPGEQVRGADRREMHADRADGEALIGAADHVHGDGVGIGGERFAAERAAPGLELPPGGAVGAAGAVAAGAGGVDRGAAGQLLDLGGAGGAVGHGERAEQGGLQGQGGAIGGPRRGRAGWRRHAGGGGEGARPWRSRTQWHGLRPRWRPLQARQPGQARANRSWRAD